MRTRLAPANHSACLRRVLLACGEVFPLDVAKGAFLPGIDTRSAKRSSGGTGWLLPDGGLTRWPI